MEKAFLYLSIAIIVMALCFTYSDIKKSNNDFILDQQRLEYEYINGKNN